jgi:hypothetical protein
MRTEVPKALERWNFGTGTGGARALLRSRPPVSRYRSPRGSASPTLAEGVPSSVHRARERERMLCGLLTCEPFRPFDRIHALSFLAVPIEAPRLLQRVLRGDQLLGSRPTDTFRLLSRRGPAASLALHVLRRCGTSLRRLAHGSSWRMLLAAAAHLPRWDLRPLCGLIHCGRGRRLRPTRFGRRRRCRRAGVSGTHSSSRRMLASCRTGRSRGRT